MPHGTPTATLSNETVALRTLARIELVAGILLLLLAIWPLSGFCSGRPLGNDCESWFIFGVNLFGPAGLLAIVCALWTLRRGSQLPQYLLLGGWVGLVGYMLLALFS